MGVLRVQDFSAVIPVKGDRAIPDNFAVESVNTWLYGSELRGVRPPTELIAVNPGTKFAFRVPKRTVGGDPNFPTVVPPPSYLGDSIWVLFTDHDVDVVRGQLVNDQFERWYFCSPTLGPMFNTYARLLAGQSMYKLGVPGPNTAAGTTDTPTITSITGGAAPVVTRAYLYTWVNEFGEESTPSLPVSGAGNTTAVWTIGNIKDPVAVTNYPTYTKKYLYRTITGTNGTTTYFRVAEIPIGTTVYADDGAVNTDAVLASKLQLESTQWALPPATLKGFIAMPNGFLVGWDKNNIYMSEPYHFHAWPAEYQQATEYPIVGMGVIGQTCVVPTQGYPASATGTHPATMSFTKGTTNEPCLARGSIVTTTDGVIYASQNGLVLVGAAGIQNVTQSLITRDDWIRLYAPQYLRSARYQNGYLSLRMVPDVASRSAFFLDPSDLKVALTELHDFETTVNVFSDVWSGEVFFLRDDKIYRWDTPSDELLPVRWLSKEYQYPFDENFGCYAIYWDEGRYSSNDWGDDFIGPTERVRFKAFCDRRLIYDQVVPKNGEGVRLPSGFKGDIWQFQICARAPVYALHVASTMKELKAV